MELADLRKIICLRKSEVYLRFILKKTVSNVIEKLVEQHCLIEGILLGYNIVCFNICLLGNL